MQSDAHTRTSFPTQKELGMCVGAHLPANHAKIYITHISSPYYRNTALGTDTFAIHMGTCRHTHLQTKSYGLTCFHTQSYMHGCKIWHSDTGYILLTSYRSQPFPTPGSYLRDLNLLSYINPTLVTIHIYTVQTCSHIQTHGSGSLLHTQRQVGMWISALMYTHTHSHCYL